MIRQEKEFLDELQIFLEGYGCKIYREVIPNECLSWERPYRVDMIIFREDIGYIGVEGKYLNTLGQGAVIAQALEQVKNYREYTYFNDEVKIKRWTIVPKFDEKFLGENTRTANIFIKGFLKFYEIEMGEWIDYKKDFAIAYMQNNNIRFNRFQNGLKGNNNGNSKINI